MKKKKPKKIHRDSKGREFIKETYFVGGKMKIHRNYVVEGIPAEDFYDKNATDLDHYMNGEYWLIKEEQESDGFDAIPTNKKAASLENEDEDLPF